MSNNFKNFSQQGLNEDVQFGKGGGRVVFRDGVFRLLLSPTGSDLTRLQVADPTDPADVVTLGSMTTAVNHVYSKLDNVSADIRTQANNLTAQTSMLSAKTDTLTASITAVGARIDALRPDSLVSPNGSNKVQASDDAVHLTGPVLIGDGSADGLIQPEGGHSLTIAGGDADAAGNVVIRGGHGAAPGHVEVHDLLDPVLPQDAMTLAAAQAALAKLQASMASGSVRCVVGSFGEKSGDTVVTTVPAGVLLMLKVSISSAFSKDTTITVKTATSTLALPAMIDEAQVGVYTIELLEDTAASPITVSIATQNGDGPGSGALAIQYIAG